MRERDQVIVGLRRLLEASPLRAEPIPALGMVSMFGAEETLQLLSSGRTLNISRSVVEKIIRLLESEAGDE